MSIENNSSEVTGIQVFDEYDCEQQPACVDFQSNELGKCNNTPIRPIGRRDGVVAKIPVVLAQLRIRVHLNSRITLPEPALEVKDIKKKLKITQCMLLPAPNDCDQDVLFIEGFVRKNIEYATRTCSNTEGVCGDIRHCTVDVPFRCSTPIKNFCRFPEGPTSNFREEFQYLKEEDLPRSTFPEKDRLMSSDLSEFNQTSDEFFNELPFCELIRSQITEFDEFINRISPSGVVLPFEEREFSEIQEKMVIAITLKILQRQQVVVPPALLQPCPPVSTCSDNIGKTSVEKNEKESQEE